MIRLEMKNDNMILTEYEYYNEYIYYIYKIYIIYMKYYMNILQVKK